jgi:CMP-N-acetylneuraminic acid synthetase
MSWVLGLVPARGGSKGIERKNIAPLAGKPLLAYTCEAALESQVLDRVILSTDDEEIADVGRHCGIEVPFVRPASISGDAASSVDVARHALLWLIEKEGKGPGILVLLQPTSPLRRSRHIDEALAKMEGTGADTVVSVTEVPHRYTPYSLMEFSQGRLKDFWKEPLPFDRHRRQDLPSLYARNGPAVLATRVSVLLEENSFYGDHVTPYLMSQEDSVDIDTPFDLEVAEWLLSRRNEA